MYLKEKTNKIKKLISLVKDENIRKMIADKIKQRGIWIKKAIAIGTLIVNLSMPVAARASSPVEFAWEGLPDVTFEHMVAEANEKDSNVSQDSWLYNVIKFGNFEDGEIKNIFEVEIHNNDNDSSYNGKKILPSELLSDKGQDELLEMLSDIPTLNSVVIKSSLPVSTVLNIKNAGYRTILEANDTAIVGIQEYVQSQGGIAIYGLENESQDVNHEHQNASIKRVIFEDNITKLKQDEMALLSLSIFHRCDKADKADSNGKVCVQIPNVSELSTKEAISLSGKVDFIRISDKDRYASGKSKVIYTLEEYIEISKSIDDLVSGIDSKASDLEKALTIYYKLGKSTAYSRGENDSNLYGVFVENSALCGGISEAFVQAYGRVGGKSEYIYGYNKGASVAHAYNQIMINGVLIDADLTGDLNNLYSNEMPTSFGARYIEFDDMSTNYNTGNRGILNQNVVKQVFEKIVRMYDKEHIRITKNTNDDFER